MDSSCKCPLRCWARSPRRASIGLRGLFDMCTRLYCPVCVKSTQMDVINHKLNCNYLIALIELYFLFLQSRPNTQHLIDKLTVAQAHLDRMD